MNLSKLEDFGSKILVASGYCRSAPLDETPKSSKILVASDFPSAPLNIKYFLHLIL
jgi:hypothetical protein